MIQSVYSLEFQLRALLSDFLSVTARGVVGNHFILVRMDHIHWDFPRHVPTSHWRGYRDGASEYILVPRADEPRSLAPKAETGNDTFFLINRIGLQRTPRQPDCGFLVLRTGPVAAESVRCNNDGTQTRQAGPERINHILARVRA